MKLAEIFAQLTHGELSQISLGGAAAGEVNASGYLQLVSHVNLGLTALHKRFQIKENRLILNLIEGVINYPLKSSYAVNGVESFVAVRTIQDTVLNPFKDDILKVERVYTDVDWELGLNNESDKYSVFTPAFNSLRIHKDLVDPSISLPDWLLTESLTVVYRANHRILTADDDIDFPEDVEIDLPDSYLEPLLYFIASRIMNPIGSGQGEMNMGNNYAAKYEQACQALEVANLQIDQGSQRTNLQRNGWV